MIERLIIALRALAGSTDAQRARIPDSVGKPEELALDFADAHLLFAQCQQLELTGAQRDAVAEVDELLDAMSGPKHEGLWTEQALRAAPEWEAVRNAARRALRQMGYT
jgi:hypothetical protein